MKNMKKVIALILVLMMLFTSCDLISDKIGGNSSDITHTEHPDHAEGPNDDQTQSDSPEHTHNYVTSVTNPTCTNEGYTKYTCTDCADTYTSDKVAALGHTEVTLPGKAPTDTENGLTDGKRCSVCNTVTVAQTTIPASGHTYTVTVINPTCTDAGHTTYTCSDCGESYVANVTPPKGHDEEIAPSKAPTCTAVGFTEGRRCMACGTVTLAQTTIPATGHSYNAVVTEPTCTESGFTTYTCSCGDSYIGNTTLAGGHNSGNAVTQNNIAPSCVDAGSYDSVTYCTYCNIETSRQTVTVPAIGHTDADNDYTCDTCNRDLCTAHTEITVPGKAATCTSTGLTDGKKCSSCGTVTLAQTIIPATNHTYSSVVTAPTCTSTGYTTYTCSCGYYYISNSVAALNHTEEAIPGKAATCTSTGLTEGKKCSVCQTVTVAQTTIAKIAHTEVTVSGKAATCTSTGLTNGKKCSVCGTVTVAQTTIAKIAHTEVTVTGTAATCSTTGLTDGKKCSVCGTVTVAQTTIAKIAHTEIEVAGKLATCTATGLTDGKKCSVCGTVTVTQTTIAALGHNWQAATTEAPKTCIACGITEGDKLIGGNTYSEILYVYYIDVGQGDSILIKVGDCDILIDAGKPGKGSTVSSYLKSKGVDDIELMINSHPDDDHYGGLTQVLTDFKVESFWGSSFSKTGSTYTSFKSAVSSEGLSFKTPSVGTVYTYESLSLTVIYNGSGASNSNDSSLVIMLEYGSFRFLFTGDISSTIENKLVSKDISCDVLKVAHHGSAGSSASAFLNATGAQYGVICVGAGNSYGHPKEAALSRLSSAGISVYRTDTSGNVVFSTNGATLTLPGGSTDSSGSGSGTSGSGSSSSGSSSSGSSSSGSTSSTEYFIGNTESKVFHLPTCSNLPGTSKQNVMYNYYWIINIAGYTPCARCLSNYSGGSSSGSGSTTTQYIANKNTGVYHLSTCSNLPDAANRVYITSTSGYTPCSRCIGSSSTTYYILNTDSNVYHLPSCSHLPDASKQKKIYSTAGYTPCGHCIK